jgi:hypothetical protein
LVVFRDGLDEVATEKFPVIAGSRIFGVQTLASQFEELRLR